MTNTLQNLNPMDKKGKSSDALKELCRYFGVPEHLTFDESREQMYKGTTFIKTVRHYNNDYQISDPDLHNQNPAEGIIRELRKKWFRTMIRTKCPKQLWYYGITLCSEVMSLAHSTTGGINGVIPLERVTGETSDISEYLDFRFYNKVWYKENAGLGELIP